MSGSGERARRVLREFWAAIIFFFTGVAFVVMASIGRVYWGENFDPSVLKYPGYGLIVVAVYVLVGVNMPRLLQGKSQVQREVDNADEE